MPAKSGNMNARKNKDNNRRMWSGRLDEATLGQIKELSNLFGLKSQGEVIDRAVKMLVDETMSDNHQPLNEAHEG